MTERSMTENTAMTQGVHHVGLTVSELESSAEFFINILEWKEVRRIPEYPAVFVTDGHIMLTLWQVQTESPVGFDKNTNIGLHHLAFVVENEDKLNQIYQKVKDSGAKIEFSPEYLRAGPAKHMMCSDPNGIRIEFIYIPE